MKIIIFIKMAFHCFWRHFETYCENCEHLELCKKLLKGGGII